MLTSTMTPMRLIPLSQIVGSIQRVSTGLPELDRVMGGGIVLGTSVQIAGDGGAGKSTMLLSVAANVSRHGTVYYVSAEEFSIPVKARADRLRIEGANIVVVENADAKGLVELMHQREKPALMIVDSIQEISEHHTGHMRRNATLLHTVSHKTGVPVIVVCHATKAGIAAGPNSVRHILDATFYIKTAPKKALAKFDDEDDRAFAEKMRFIVTDKNRNGDTGQVGFMFMEPNGLWQLDAKYRKDWMKWWKENGS